MALFFVAAFRWMRENPKLVGAIFAVFFVIGLALGLYWKGRHDDAVQREAATAAARAALDAKATHADAVASTQRQLDNASVANELATTKGTIDAQKDDAPSDASLALNCRRLLRQGTPLSKIPACGRFAAGR